MFRPDPNNTVIINATSIGHKFHGIGVYSFNILKELSRLETNLNFIVYVNKSCEKYISEIHFPGNFKLIWVTSKMSPDHKFIGHLFRLIYSNLISFRHWKYLQFNTSQFELNFFRSNQIVTIHDVIPLLFRKYHIKQYFYFKVILIFRLMSARYVLTPSFHSKQMLMSVFRLPNERVKVIHSGANTVGLDASTVAIKEKEDYILYVGRINEMKNLTALLRAFSIIYKKINHNLLIVSDDKIALDREIKASNLDKYLIKKIIFKKNLTDKEKYCVMKKAAMLVFPSLYEGFGLPPIEAMACGCPVIASNTSSIPEVCGNAAIYIDPYNHNSIAEGITELIEDCKLRERMIELGLERARKFNWELSAREHLRVFENVLARGKLPVETGQDLIPVLKNRSHSGLIR